MTKEYGIKDAHRRMGEGKERTPPPSPQTNFIRLVNKNAIKPKIGRPTWQFFLKALPSPRDFGKNLTYPPPWIFNPCAFMYGMNSSI
jgi:hypothetical protein